MYSLLKNYNVYFLHFVTVVRIANEKPCIK